MPIGGPIIETIPDTCASGHAWGEPIGGVTRVIIGHQPCHCSTSRGSGHRSFHCEKPGCTTPWTLRPPCTGDDMRASIVTAPRTGQ